MGRERIAATNQSASLLEYFTIIFIEPILFAFVLFLLFERLKTVMDYTSTYPEYSFLQLINADIKMNEWFYVAFVIVFALWALSKAIKYRDELIKYREERCEKKQLIESLEAIRHQLEKFNDKT